jgi:hypothetical protein
MNNFEFRVWVPSSKEMIYHTGLITVASVLYPPEWVKNGIFLEYTTLQDKNGKKIFKKDIIRFEDELYIVEWHYCKWVMRSLKRRKLLDFLDADMRRLEVIGNIYENPELWRKHDKQRKDY